MKSIILFLIGGFWMMAQGTEEQRINTLLDAWHQAAAEANEQFFFHELMDSTSIYIGTDASELWTASELEQWSQKYFDREVAWDFKPQTRNVYFSQSGSVAWFDELLTTWMGDCRGSGVLEKLDNKWVLRHYHLAIAVPNDVVKEYLKLLPKKD